MPVQLARCCLRWHLSGGTRHLDICVFEHKLSRCPVNVAFSTVCVHGFLCGIGGLPDVAGGRVRQYQRQRRYQHRKDVKYHCMHRSMGPHSFTKLRRKNALEIF